MSTRLAGPGWNPKKMAPKSSQVGIFEENFELSPPPKKPLKSVIFFVILTTFPNRLSRGVFPAQVTNPTLSQRTTREGVSTGWLKKFPAPDLTGCPAPPHLVVVGVVDGEQVALRVGVVLPEAVEVRLGVAVAESLPVGVAERVGLLDEVGDAVAVGADQGKEK